MSFEPGDILLVVNNSIKFGHNTVPFKVGDHVVVDEKKPGEGMDFVSLVGYSGKFSSERFALADVPSMDEVDKVTANLRRIYEEMS